MPGAVEIPWRRLRLSLAVFAAPTLVGAAAAAAAWWQEHRAAERMEAAETRLATARGRYAALAGEREKWRRFGPLYRRLAARGRIGGEQPARWTEAARHAMTGMPAARLRIGSTRVVENDGPTEMRATDMSIELRLRHEAELTRFLSALERDAPGTFTVSGCRLARTDGSAAREPPPASAPDEPNAIVDAACRIRWQSVVLSGVGPGWTPAADLDGGRAAETGWDGWDGWEAAPGEPPRNTFDRLFTTAAERARIDAALAARAVAPEADETPSAGPARSRPLTPAEPEPARWVRVGGIVARSGRSVFAWIDGRRVAYGDSLAERPAPAEPRAAAVRVDAGGRSILVRPGQRFDPGTGAVSDPICRPKPRAHRARSLQESSAAPLTVPPAGGHN